MSLISIQNPLQGQILFDKYKADFEALENNQFHAFLVGPTYKSNGLSWMVFYKDCHCDSPRKTIIQFISQSRAKKIATALNEALVKSKVK